MSKLTLHTAIDKLHECLRKQNRDVIKQLNFNVPRAININQWAYEIEKFLLLNEQNFNEAWLKEMMRWFHYSNDQDQDFIAAKQKYQILLSWHLKLFGATSVQKSKFLTIKTAIDFTNNKR